MTTTPKRVDYLVCARRHRNDAEILLNNGARPNAGQLYGMSVECGLKAWLIQLGAETTADGTIRDELKRHLPQLITEMTILPDGRQVTLLHAAAPHLGKLHNWRIEHRYWRAKDIPLAHLTDWQSAAREVLMHLDSFL